MLPLSKLESMNRDSVSRTYLFYSKNSFLYNAYFFVCGIESEYSASDGRTLYA